jgi:HAD superfamily hydrolase (TIGR01509 family)/HAD superfamily hydrolase (TIGR01549 family)
MLTTSTGFRYDWVIFDVGGTLIGFYQEAPFREFLTQANLPASKEDARRFHRELIGNISAERHRAEGKGASPDELDDWWRSVFAKTWLDRDDLVEEMLRWMLAGRFDRVFPDVLPTLEALQAMGMPMAVISNFGTHLRDLLAQKNLLRFFDSVLVSAEVGIAKPDPRIFDLMAERVDLPRQRLLYAGDHIGDDIDGAHGAGLDAVLIDRRNHHPDALCPRIGSLLELKGYVQIPTRPARAIILDMDGVVLDSPPLHLLTWQRTLAPLGIELTAEDHYPLEGLPTEVTAQRLTERFLGEACSEQEAQRLANTKRALFREMFHASFVPGIVPLLYDLRGRGYLLGLVTGSARSVVDESLVPTGVASFFEVIVAGDEVAMGKPDPEPYHTAAARLGIPPDQCLAVENAPLGIASAKASGMGCVALQTTLPAEQLSAADRVFPNVQAMRAWLFAS